MSEVKKLSLRIPKELHKELKILAAKDDKTMNDIICDMIVQYIVNSHKKKPSQDAL
jgi:predicted HicB family RNase H-like nuclease